MLPTGGMFNTCNTQNKKTKLKYLIRCLIITNKTPDQKRGLSVLVLNLLILGTYQSSILEY